MSHVMALSQVYGKTNDHFTTISLGDKKIKTGDDAFKATCEILRSFATKNSFANLVAF